MEDYKIISISENTTKIIACRKGDIFTWVYDRSDMWSTQTKYYPADYWIAENGDNVLLTNRIDDVPEWFPLSHSMVCGRDNVNKMLEKLNKGYEPNKLGIEVESLPEVWQVNVYHYIIWYGESRPDISAENGILGIFRFETGALVINQKRDYSSLIFPEDTPDDAVGAPGFEIAERIKSAFYFIKSQGKPRKYAEEWKLG